MVFITAQEILETVSMIRSENLDVRAVTMGITLDDCAAGEPRGPKPVWVTVSWPPPAITTPTTTPTARTADASAAAGRAPG